MNVTSYEFNNKFGHKVVIDEIRAPDRVIFNCYVEYPNHSSAALFCDKVSRPIDVIRLGAKRDRILEQALVQSEMI